MCGNYTQKASVTDMQTSLKWDSLEQRRFKSIVTMGYKTVHKLVAVPSDQLIPIKESTRGNGMKFHRIGAKQNYYKYSFFPILVSLWNSLPSRAALAEKLEDFKQELSSICLKSVYHN